MSPRSPRLRATCVLTLWSAACFFPTPAEAQVTTALQFIAVPPCRVMDTRNANGTFGGPIIAAATSRDVPVPLSPCGIPTSAQAYSLNVTVVPPAGLAFISLWPTGQPQPVVSTLNSFDGRIVANAAIVPAGTNGSISLFASNATHAIIDINGYFVPASNSSSLAFYAISPCRVADTRGNGFTGAFGAPSMTTAARRTFPIPSGSCAIPSTARAYSVNMTVVPAGPLAYLTTWPTGQSQPLVSTLNSYDGDIVANAAIVPAGTSGSIDVFVTNPTDVIIDINGYFAPPGAAGAQALYAVPPCRVADTRGNGFTGAFGTPTMAASSTRTFPMPSSSCNIPANAQVHSTNVTVVPPAPLAYLTAWPTGQSRPLVSTLNSFQGKITANAALVPAGQNGAIDVFVTQNTDVIIDTNGFFAPAGGNPYMISAARTSATAATAYSYPVFAANPNPAASITFSLPVAPAGMTINASTGLIQWTPTLAQLGAQSVQVMALDSQGRSGTQSFSITVASGGQDPAGVIFTSGTTTPLATQTIGPTGGTINISGTGTPADGIKVVFPAGALEASDTVSVTLDRGTVAPNSGTFPGSALAVNVTGPNRFAQPITITVPYNGGGNAVPVPYFVDTGGKLRPAQITGLNRQAGTFTFQTFHASLFTWIWANLNPPSGNVTTAYLPANDGFQIVNYGSTYNRGGECFGMSAFSLWYLLNQKAGLGRFYPKYMANVGTDSDGKTIVGQNVIATRAFTSITQNWTAYIPEVRRQQNLTELERYASINNIIANTGAPVLIYLWQSTGTAAHSILAYGVDNSTHKISVYDPNLPSPQTPLPIQFSTSSNSFTPYCNGACYDGIIYNGDGSLNLSEPYSNIVVDAQQNFNNNGGATISITSHVSGQVLATRLTTLSGTVRSGQLLVTKITVIVGSTEYVTAVPLNGVFNVPIALADGVNHIKFRTEGLDSHRFVVTTSNNFDTQDFTLKAVVPASMILMTLTWDKNDTDVDTYVIDPTGDYSSYYHKTTADGGVLDQDIITGYGPEHWTLLNTNTVRYNQPYKFRIHYYSDHGNGPTNYTVTIELYNGTSRQVTYTYTGALSVSNSSNDRPTGTGADWADIATITLTQATSATLSEPAVPGNGGGIVIRVPVPEPGDRKKLKP